MAETKNKVITEFDANIGKATKKIAKLRREVRKYETEVKGGAYKSPEEQKQYDKNLKALDKENNKLKENQQVKKKALSEEKQVTRTKKQAMEGMQKEMMLQGLTQKQSAKAIENVNNRMQEQGFTYDETGQFINKQTGQIVSLNKAMSYGSRSVMPQFKGEYLSLLFIGQGLSATFGGMITQVLQMTGIFDAFRGVLAGILLPILMPLVTTFLDLFSTLGSNPATAKFLGWLIIVLASLGTLLSMAAQLALLMGAFGATIGIATFATIMGVIAFAFVTIFGVLQLISGIVQKKIVPIFRGLMLIITGIAGILALIFGWIPAIIVGVVTLILWLLSFLKPVRELLEKIQNWFGGKGFKSDAQIGLKPMAEEGIVTGPTPALIGEAGPEAVIPLNRAGDTSIGSTINYNPTINFNGSSGSMNDRDIADKVNRALFDSLRSGL